MIMLEYLTEILQESNIKKNMLLLQNAGEKNVMEHCIRTAFCAEQIAQLIHLDKTLIKEIVRGALLHDMGKLLIPAQILFSPGKLTINEMDIIKQHPSLGCNLLKKDDFSNIVYDITEMHHEKLDGSGYPAGLSAANIPLYVQIVTVSDMYEAMTSKRCYKPAFCHSDALKILQTEVQRNKVSDHFVSLLT